MQGFGSIALAVIVATGLVLSGCSDPAAEVSPPVSPADPLPAAGQVESGVPDEAVPDKEEVREPAPAGERETTRKPLDLSMPQQPAFTPDPGSDTDPSGSRLLPDLFQQEQKPDPSDAMLLKGRVLMREGEEQTLDSFEGGQLILEKKTR
jgi:hypothetical protein